MKTVNVGLFGFGTVGTGVAKILLENSNDIAERTGIKLVLRKICDIDLERPRGLSVPEGILTTRAEDILDDPEIAVVVELIGGTDVSKDYIIRALRGGKDVVTANKALLATRGTEVFAEALSSGRALGFEASVGGAIPIISSVTSTFLSNRVISAVGILNGTCNYILTRMVEEGMEYGKALTEAQGLGYAEADPRLDVEGIDSAHKLAVLARLCFARDFDYSEIYVEGISNVTLEDTIYAKQLGYIIKLLAIGKNDEDEIDLRVHPTLIPLSHPLASVRDVFNAVEFVGEAMGRIMLYGCGAGQMPAASAVVSDIIDVALGRSAITSKSLRVFPTRTPRTRIKPIEEIKTRYYLRFSALDKPGVLSHIAGALGNHNISISSVIQQEERRGEAVPVVMMTHKATEDNLKRALHQIDNFPIVKQPTAFMRVLE